MSEAAVSTSTPKIIYILYLVGILVPFVSIIGLVMAYINKDDAPEWLQTHYQFQIRTFWIGFLYGFIGLLLTMIVIGYFVLLFTVIWFVIRSVKGMKYLDTKEAYPNPMSWMFS